MPAPAFNRQANYGQQVFRAGDTAENAFSGEIARIALCFVDRTPEGDGWFSTHCVVAQHPDGEFVVAGQGAYNPVAA